MHVKPGLFHFSNSTRPHIAASASQAPKPCGTYSQAQRSISMHMYQNTPRMTCDRKSEAAATVESKRAQLVSPNCHAKFHPTSFIQELALLPHAQAELLPYARAMACELQQPQSGPCRPLSLHATRHAHTRTQRRRATALAKNLLQEIMGSKYITQQQRACPLKLELSWLEGRQPMLGVNQKFRT